MGYAFLSRPSADTRLGAKARYRIRRAGGDLTIPIGTLELPLIFC